jgi:hypothetical protein
MKMIDAHVRGEVTEHTVRELAGVFKSVDNQAEVLRRAKEEDSKWAPGGFVVGNLKQEQSSFPVSCSRRMGTTTTGGPSNGSSKEAHVVRRGKEGGGKKCIVCKGGGGYTRALVRCRQCGEVFHKACFLGLPAKACLTGFIDCVDCAMFELKILDEEAAEQAGKLHLEGIKVAARSKADGTNANMISYMFGKGASVRRFATEVLYLGESDVMPPEEGKAMDVLLVGMYIVWVASRLAWSSLGNYVNAIAQWHKATGIPKERWPTEHPSISYRLVGLKRTMGEGAGARGKKAPVSIGLLAVMFFYWEGRATADHGVKLLAMKQQALI